MKSRIYKGFVEHTRFLPVHHVLKYSLFVYCLDLDELAGLDQTLPLFGYNRFKPASIHDSDYLDAVPAPSERSSSVIWERASQPGWGASSW
jgi:DUF1365 family protein